MCVHYVAMFRFFFFLNDPAPPDIYSLPPPAPLPLSPGGRDSAVSPARGRGGMPSPGGVRAPPPAVTDEMVADLRRDLDDAQLVELTMMVAVENVRSRFNSALGLTSQGFRDRCELPATA